MKVVHQVLLTCSYCAGSHKAIHNELTNIDIVSEFAAFDTFIFSLVCSMFHVVCSDFFYKFHTLCDNLSVTVYNVITVFLHFCIISIKCYYNMQS